MADGQPGSPHPRLDDDASNVAEERGHRTVDWRHAAVAAAPTGIVLFDFTGRVLDANPAFAALVERRSSQAREMNLLDVAAPNYLQGISERLGAAADGRASTISLELRVPVSGGPTRHVVGDATVLHDLEQRPVAALAHVRDVTGERLTLDSLRRADEQLDAVASGASLVAFSFGLDGAVRTWSPAAVRLFGWPVASVLGRAAPVSGYTDPWGGRREGFAGDEFANVELSGHRPDGTVFRCRLTLAPQLDEHGRRAANVAIMNDTGRRPRTDEPSDTESANPEPYRVLLHKMADTVTVLDGAGHLLYSSSENKEILGYAPAFWDERSAFDLAHPDDLDRANAVLRRVVDTPGLTQTGEFRARRADGAWEAIEFTGMNLLDDPEVAGIIVTTRRIADRPDPLVPSGADEQVVALGARLAHQVMHDALTGLPNRSLLVDRIDNALALGGAGATVLLIDLDRFKVVNDSLGHQAGDQLLVQVAERLEQALASETALLGRFGGDEFVVVLDAPTDLGAARRLAARLQAEMSRPFPLERSQAVLTMSVGIALGGADDDSDTLLRNAAAAMYRVKDRGGDGVDAFDDTLRVRMLDRLHFENDLRDALDHGELTLSYQPTVSLESGQVIGVEALLRWTHPERGEVGPSQFVPVAEESGLIVPLGAWVLNEAIGQAATWLRDVPGHPHFLLSVNLSPRQLASPDLVPLIRGLLDRHGWPAEYLALELTESILLDDVDTTIEVLQSLKALGVRLAVDDFGTGYSSLSYLERYPFDIVKIDQSFVEGLGSSGGGLAITAAVVLMARALGLITVAEGIETRGQSAVLQSLGCDWGQGYHFARPLPAAEAGALLHTTL